MRDLPGDLGLIVIDDLPEMIGCVKGFGLGDYFFSSFGFFLTISLTNSSALVICSGVISLESLDLNLSRVLPFSSSCAAAKLYHA